MKRIEDYITKANEALLEGDRDGAIRLIDGRPSSVEVLWLRSQCVTSEKERESLLGEVFESNHPVYSPLSEEILEREKSFTDQLEQPPDYQFWKKPTWGERIQQLKQQRWWVLGISFLFVMTILMAVSLNAASRQNALAAFQATQTMKFALSLPTATIVLSPTVTRIPDVGPALYPNGQFSIIRFEKSTHRPVIQAGSYVNNGPVQPAAGAVFWAFEYRFICREAVCNQPPEVEKIILELNGGGETAAGEFVLAEFPTVERIADGRSTTGWLVFEVPENIEPKTFVLYYDQENTVELHWKP